MQDERGVSPPDVARTLGVGLDGRRRRRWLWPLIALAALGLLAVGAAALWPREAPPAWETAQVRRGALVIEVTAVGTLEPLHTVKVGSDVSGVVAEVFVETNQTVKAGQVLLRLDTTLLEAQTRQAKAALAAGKAAERQAKVALQGASSELARAERVSASAALSAADLEAARLARDRAEAALQLAVAQRQQAEATLDQAQTNLARATITSPIDGVVLSRAVDPGQAVVSALSAATLFEVAEDLGRMSVEVEIDEADVARVQPEQRATFTVSAHPDRVFDAHVDKVELAPKPGSAVVTYLACLHLDNAEGLLRPGMTATARIDAERLEDRLLLPTAALRFQPPGQDLPPPAERAGRRVGRVWVPDEDGPRPVEVVTGGTDGRDAVLEEGELEVGDAVIVGSAAPEPR